MTIQRFAILLVAVAILLLVPFVAMKFTEEVAWSLSDFIIMGVLLTLTGLACDFAWRKMKTTPLKIFICLSILLIFFLIWAELAVGLFGTRFAGS